MNDLQNYCYQLTFEEIVTLVEFCFVYLLQRKNWNIETVGIGITEQIRSYYNINFA